MFVGSIKDNKVEPGGIVFETKNNIKREIDVSGHEFTDLSSSYDILPSSREDDGPNSAEGDQTPPNEERKASQSPIKTQV